MSGEASTIRATVRQAENGWANVEVTQGGCGRCHEKGGCGGQHLTQMFCSGPRHYQVKNDLGAQAGEEVLVAVTAGTVRRSANLVYGLPLAGLFAGAILGAQLAQDAGAMLGGLVGLVLAFAFLAKKSRRGIGNSAQHPYIISRSTDKQEESQQ
jgi:sigma-E factor negative regulatory protein RseC